MYLTYKGGIKKLLFTENVQIESKKVVMTTGILIFVTDHEAVVGIMTSFVCYTFFIPFALELVFS